MDHDQPPAHGAWPRISIVIPSYNQGQFLEETIRSVLLQGYQDLELLIIDGRSSDGSVDIIQKYEKWVTYWVSEKDRGQSEAINKGLARCSGEIITFLSSDDIYLKGTLQDVAKRWMECPEVGAVVGGFFYLDENSRLGQVFQPPRFLRKAPLDLALVDLDQWRLHQVATFFTREALDGVGRFVRTDLHYAMDRELLYRVCRKYPILPIERPYSGFRLHSRSKSRSVILAFARELASLHLSNSCKDGREAIRRQSLARWHMAKGYLRYAKCSDGTVFAALALLAAVLKRPVLILQRSYLVAWLDVLRIGGLLRRARGRIRGGADLSRRAVSG